jgi:serine protease AprX
MRTTTFASRLRRALLLIIVLSALHPATTQGQTPRTDKLAPVLQARSRQIAGRSRVIVQFRGNSDTRVITGNGGVAGRQLASIGAQVADLDNWVLADLARSPHVAWVGVDHPAFPTLERTGAAIAATLARQAFNLTGKGIGVAVIDSGITAWHDDLYLTGSKSPRAAPRVVHFKDFTTEVNPRVWASDQPSDEFGHGTHVAGIIAGNGFDSDGARTGVAPGANLVGLKVLDAEGHGYISDVIAAVDYAIAVKDVYNIRVINLSVASGVFESYNTDPLTLAARRAVDAGIVVVSAAGNIGTNKKGETQYGGITSPGNAPWVLTVGAASHEGTPPRSNDTLARFSSRGPTWIDFAAKPDLVAPGVGTESLSDPHSTFYSAYADYLLDGTRSTPYKPYLSLTGTSMAAPVVAGTVALMLEANPDLTPNAVKAILQYTAEVREGESFLAQGAGLLNALGAVRMATFFEAPKKGMPVPGDTIEDEPIEWSQHIIWGNDRIDGGIPLPGSNAWALGVTWGADATNAGRPIVWGVQADDNIVWSTSEDDNIVWSTSEDDNIVWSTSDDDNIVWSTSDDDNIVWSTSSDDNIVWSTSSDDNIVWSTSSDDNIVWSTAHSDNIVWSTDCGGADCEGVVWGARGDGDFVWGTAEQDDNIVWSTSEDDNIVWSTGDVDQILWPAAQPVDNRRRAIPGRH